MTTNDNTITFPSGFYEEFTVSTDIKDIKGDISYSIGHKHIGNETTMAGCYTVANGTKKIKCPGYGTIRQFKTIVGGEIVCNTCGQTYASSYFEGRGGQIGYCDKYTYVSVYKTGCGHEEKEFIRETADPTLLADDEQIISCTITY